MGIAKRVRGLQHGPNRLRILRQALLECVKLLFFADSKPSLLPNGGFQLHLTLQQFECSLHRLHSHLLFENLNPRIEPITALSPAFGDRGKSEEGRDLGCTVATAQPA